MAWGKKVEPPPVVRHPAAEYFDQTEVGAPLKRDNEKSTRAFHCRLLPHANGTIARSCSDARCRSLHRMNLDSCSVFVWISCCAELLPRR